MWIDRFVKLLFLFGIAIFGFAYGVLTIEFEIFPYALIRDAQTAAGALFGSQADEDAPEAAMVSEPTVRSRAGTDDGALILVSGGEGYYESQNSGDGCLAWLMDRSGTVKHVWKYPTDLWDDLQDVRSLPGARTYPLGVELLADGSLLASFQGLNTWPYSIGLAKFDRDSRLLWKKENHAHHWFVVAPDGKIITPSQRIIDSPHPIGGTQGSLRSREGKILEDTILICDADGNTLDEISLLDAVHGSGLVGLYQGARGGAMSDGATTWDPLHLNSVTLVDDALAAEYDGLDPGDMLLSFRSINMIGVLDPVTRRFKWLSQGTTIRPHSPRFYDGGVIVFDNLGGDTGLGRSRLTQLDFGTRLGRTVFPVAGMDLPCAFESRFAGHIDVNRDRERILVAVTHKGVVWELNPRTGALLWEFTYAHSDGSIRPIYTAKYCYDVSFLTSGEGERHDR